uniref:Protein kinase domain-containing protein n=1 Tax=Parastrongyloides trichosuri TaxID=131310 RepID=A0A0N4ZFY8_PARTI
MNSNLTIDISKADVSDADMHKYLFSNYAEDISIDNVINGLVNYDLNDFESPVLSDEKKIGSGAFADIFKVLHKNGKEMAVKIMKTKNTTNNFHFYHEVNTLKQLNHSNIVKFYGVIKGEINGIVLEYYRNGNLKYLLENWKEEFSKNTKNWILNIASALLAIHKINFVHGDVNPCNILLSNDYSNAILCDFGSSKLSGKKPEAFAGLSCYRAPEINLSALYVTKCDVYSFGIIMWEIFTREPPYDTSKDDVELMWDLAYTDLKPDLTNPKIPLEYKRIISLCIEKNLDDRISTEMLYEELIKNA